MRRINAKAKALSAVPVGGYVEVLRDVGSDKESKPQYLLASIFGSAEALDAVVAGGGSEATATVGGGTTGLIGATAQFIAVTSGAATSQISLPAALGGKVLRIFVAATGCELISVVAADKVNNVIVGATNEAALVAGTLYTLVYDGVDNWVMSGLTALGAVEAPVIPDAL